MDSRDQQIPSTPDGAPSWWATQPPSWPYPTGASPQARRPRPRRRLRRRATTLGIAVATAAVATGAGLGVHAATTPSAATPVGAQPRWSDTGWSDTGWSGTRWSGTSPGGWDGGRGALGRGGAGTRGGAVTGATTAATDAQEAGVVDIDVVLGGTERAAGTGMLLTSDGEVLTNRHVVEGETSISVTVPATGATYAARVVGMSTTTDVAVVQLTGASGLTTVRTASGAVSPGDAVIGVGNAGGAGGTPSAAAGTVTGVNAGITASDTDGSNPEQLTGLIETDAAIQPGDSGGPLLNASGQVVGMDTAGAAEGDDGFAIPIATVLAAGRQIETGGAGTQAGAGTSTATRPDRVYLGVEVQDSLDDGTGVVVGAVLPGSPAEAAGITAGDTLISVAGHRVDSVAGLSSVMTSLTAGRWVTVTWVDGDGTTHSARVTPVTARG